LTAHEVIVQLVATTRTETGLLVQAELVVHLVALDFRISPISAARTFHSFVRRYTLRIR
jgi:hypothetical protein